MIAVRGSIRIDARGLGVAAIMIIDALIVQVGIMVSIIAEKKLGRNYKRQSCGGQRQSGSPKMERNKGK